MSKYLCLLRPKNPDKSSLNENIEVYSLYENKLIGKIEVIGTSVVQQLAVVFAKGGGSATEIDFGTVYFGQTKEISAFLVNNGPAKINYKFFFHPNKHHSLVNENDSDFACTPYEAGVEMSQRILSAEPQQGYVKPYEQIPIVFKCKTNIPNKTVGWRKDICQFREGFLSKHPEIVGEAPDPKTDIYSTAAIQFEDGNEYKVNLKNPEDRIAKTITVYMKVQACYPEFTLDKTMLNFWECRVHERKKITLRLTNKHADLPLDFSFNKISFFTANPTNGLIAPNDALSQRSSGILNYIDIDITFHPESFGNCSDVLILRYINNMFNFPIRVMGSCKQMGKLEKKTRGPEANENDFKLEAEIVPDEKALNYTEPPKKVKKILKNRS